MKVKQSRLIGLTIGAFAAAICVHGVPVSSQEASSELPQDPYELRVRHAEASLELAKVQHELLERARKNTPFRVTQSEVDRSKANVETAKEQLRIVQAPGTDAVELHLAHAREQAKVARDDYQAAVSAWKEKPEKYFTLQMEELRLSAEVAELRLAIWSNPDVSVLSLLDHMHWQLERLSEDVVELQNNIKRLD